MAKEISQKEAREFKRQLEKLSLSVLCFLQEVDVVFKRPATVERGKEVARWCNKLEYVNDSVRHFTLGYPLDEDKVRLWQREKAKANQASSR